MLEDFVEVLDRAWASLDAETGVSFALNCFRMHELLVRDARSNAVLEMLRIEEANSHAAFAQALGRITQALAAIVDEVEPTSEAQTRRDFSKPTPVRELLGFVRGNIADPGFGADVNERYHDVDLLCDAMETLAQMTNLPADQETLVSANRQLAHAHRTHRIFHRTSAASSLASIERNLHDLHPPEEALGDEAKLEHLSRIQRTTIDKLSDALFGDASFDPARHLNARAFIDEMRLDMRRIYEDVRRRIGSERSLLALFERYRQRCQWYEAGRLRAIAEDPNGVGKPEDRLTETLASYLFDQGLNPLTRPLAGALQPDLLGTGSRFSFYVEAKQHSKACRGYLLKGMQQVWDMLGQLDGSGFDVREAFYVVYRLSGPRYDFPQRLQFRDRVVHLLMIDLAPTTERGSNARPTRAFEESELLPLPATERAALDALPDDSE